MDWTPKRPTPIHWIRQIIEPREPEPPKIERPGEVYADARYDLPALICRLSIGIVVLAAFRLPWIFVGILAVIYWCIHGLSKTFARYMDHGDFTLSLSMSLVVWALIAWQVVTLGGQAAVEVVYRLKIDEEAGYVSQKAAYPADLEKFWKDENARQNAWREREAARAEREKVRQAASAETTKQVRALLALSKSNKDVKINGSVRAGEGNPEPPEEFKARMPPTPPVPPAYSAAGFLARWALRLKIWQLIEFGVAVVGLFLLVVRRVWVNHRGRVRIVSQEDRELLPLVNGDRATLSNLQSWRSPSLLLDDSEKPDSPSEMPDQESREEGESREAPESSLEAPCPVEMLPEAPLSLPDSTSYLTEWQEWKANISHQANKLRAGDSLTPWMHAEMSAIRIQKAKESAFWNVITNAANKLNAEAGNREPATVSGSPACANTLPETEIQGVNMGITVICGGDYKLKQKRKDGKPAGFDIRDRSDEYTGYTGQKAGETLMLLSEDAQRAEVQKIKNKRLGIPTLPRAVNEQ